MEWRSPHPCGRSLPASEQDGLWRSIIDAMSDAAIVLDRAGMVLHFNAYSRELFPRLGVGMPLSQVSRNPELIEAADRSGELTAPIEVQLIEHVPVERRISVRLSRLKVRDAAATDPAPAVLISFRDLSEQDRLAQMRPFRRQRKPRVENAAGVAARLSNW